MTPSFKRFEEMLALAAAIRETWTHAKCVHEDHEQRVSFASSSFSDATRARYTAAELARTARYAAGPCPCTDCFHKRVIARAS